MTTPPPLPPVQPPPLPKRQPQIPTAVYCLFFCLLFTANAVLAYRQAFARFPNNSAAAVGYVQGGLLMPLVVVAAIACIWKQNRGFRGVVRVLFWVSLITLFAKFGNLASSMQSRPNQTHTLDGGTVRLSQIARHWSAASDARRSAG